jgi:hypothetical protein
MSGRAFSFVRLKTVERLSQILANSFSSIQHTRRVIAECVRDPNLLNILDPALPLVESTKTEDFKENTRAFLEKRGKKN